MSLSKENFKNALTPPLPGELVDQLLVEYHDIKINLVLARYSPTELTGGRFAECVFRIIQHLHDPPFTPFGKQMDDVNGLIRRVESNVQLPDSIRVYIPKLGRVLLDVRNRRNVAHAGGDVDPNFSDSMLVSQIADWILIELIRTLSQVSINEARLVVDSINQIHIPVIYEIDGIPKILNDKINNTKDRTLVILYYKNPIRVTDSDLVKWLKYKNESRFRLEVLTKLDQDSLIHYHLGRCSLTPKGVFYVEKNLPLSIEF